MTGSTALSGKRRFGAVVAQLEGREKVPLHSF